MSNINNNLNNNLNNNNLNNNNLIKKELTTTTTTTPTPSPPTPSNYQFTRVDPTYFPKNSYKATVTNPNMNKFSTTPEHLATNRQTKRQKFF